MELQDRVIVVTGGGQGLGRAMAVSLAERGAQLVLVDLDPQRLEESAELCRQAGGKATGQVVNVAQEEEVTALFEQVAADYGALHGLVNNAGILRDGLLVRARDGKVEKAMSLAEWQAVIDVNLTGVFLCGREAARQMIELDSPGLILNISSISKAGNMGQTNYSAAKAGVAAMTVAWARELARYGIRVAGIAPGFIATDMVASMKPEALEKMTAGIPLGRLGQPEEIGHTAVYLFENDYVTGRIIEMDGGLRF